MSEAPEVPGTPPIEPTEGSLLGTQSDSGPASESGGASTEGGSTEAATGGDDTSTAASGADSLTSASYQFTLPDDVTLDDAAMTTLKETFATNKVPPDAGQALLNMHVSELKRSAESWALAQQTAWNTTTDAWKAELAADPEYGAAKMPQVQLAIGKALDEYGTPEARQAFDLTGAGWNPHIVRMFHKMALALAEGSPHAASGPTTNRHRTPGEILYPDLKQG